MKIQTFSFLSGPKPDGILDSERSLVMLFGASSLWIGRPRSGASSTPILVPSSKSCLRPRRKAASIRTPRSRLRERALRSAHPDHDAHHHQRSLAFHA